MDLLRDWDAILIKVNAAKRIRGLYAVCLAVMLHSLAFLYLDFPTLSNVVSVSQPLLLNVEIVSNSSALEKATKETSSPPDQTAKQQSPELTTPDVVSAIDDSKEKQKSGVEATISQQSLKEWLKSETGRFSNKHSPALGRFQESFDAQVVEKKPDIRYTDSVPSPLGGGLYKIRKNGVTCDQITFVPMTMDEQLHGTIKIIDNCSKEDKMKVKIGKSK